MNRIFLSPSASPSLCGKFSSNQKGVSIIAVIAIMLMLSVMGVALVTMVTTGSTTSINQLRSEQALNIARGGIEFGLYTTTRGGGSWGEFTFSNRALGAGSFTMSTNTSIVSGRRRITIDSTGTVPGLMVAQKRVIVFANRTSGGGGSGEVVTGGIFPSLANFNANWIKSLTEGPAANGNSQWDGINSATADASGSLYAYTNLGANLSYAGYREQTLSFPIIEDSQLALTLSYKKAKGSGNPNEYTMNIYVSLVYSDNTSTQIWMNTDKGNIGWTVITPVNFTVPGGKTVTKIRLGYNLTNLSHANAKSEIWFDNISITASGTGDIPVNLTRYEDVY